MKSHPLVEFEGSVAVALDSIESIDWVNAETTRITTITGRVISVPCTWDQAMISMYGCITHNEKSHQ